MNPIMQFLPLVVLSLVILFIILLFKALEKNPKRDEVLASGPKIKYRLKATLFCLAGFFFAAIARTVIQDAGEHITWPIAIFLAPYVQWIGIVLWYFGCYVLVHGKGYRWFWALLGLFPLIGLIVLGGFKNKRGPESPSKSKSRYILWVIAVLLIPYILFTAWHLFVISVTSEQRASRQKEISASKSNEPSGVIKSYYESGQLKSEGTYKNGKKEGVFKYYLENGQLKTEGAYKNGELEGQFKDYAESPSPKARKGFRDRNLSDDDQKVFDWLVAEFKKAEGIDLSKEQAATWRLKEAVEIADNKLKTAQSAEINLPFIVADASGPKHLLMTLTRDQIDNLFKATGRKAPATFPVGTIKSKDGFDWKKQEDGTWRKIGPASKA